MKNKFGIIKVIAAFGYEEVILSDGQHVDRDKVTEDGRSWLIGSRIPRSFCDDLANHLVDLAGWRHMDNKVCFMFQSDWESGHGSVRLLSFYDGNVTHVSFYESWEKVPANVVRGQAKVQAAYDKYRAERKWEDHLAREAKIRRTISYTNEQAGGAKCTVCGERTWDRLLGTVICRDCCKCEECHGDRPERAHFLLNGKRLCGYCLPPTCQEEGCDLPQKDGHTVCAKHVPQITREQAEDIISGINDLATLTVLAGVDTGIRVH